MRYLSTFLAGAGHALLPLEARDALEPQARQPDRGLHGREGAHLQGARLVWSRRECARTAQRSCGSTFDAAERVRAQVADIGLLRPRTLNELDDAGVHRVLPWTAPELVRQPATATEKVCGAGGPSPFAGTLTRALTHGTHRPHDVVRLQVDTYAFGMVMWCMWARRQPYEGQDIARVFLHTMQGHRVRPPLPGAPPTCFPR